MVHTGVKVQPYGLAVCDHHRVTWTESDASRATRKALVQLLRAEGHLRSPRIAAAVEAVPREVFVPGVDLAEVYRSTEAIVTKRVDGIGVSSASAPNVVALMLEQLDPQPGDRVLEIGAGTGYNAALLAHLVGPTGSVTSIDIDEDLVQSAREHLDRAGYSQVEVLTHDGALGYPSARTFDRIILTVASRDIAPAWTDQLSRPGGRLVLPLRIRGPQRSIAFVPENAHLVSTSLQACQFIPLRGVLAAPPVRVPISGDGAVGLVLPDDTPPLSAGALAEMFQQPRGVWSTGIAATHEDVRDALHLWLVAHDASVFTVWADPAARAVPDLFGINERFRGSLCALAADALAVLGWANEDRKCGELCVQAPPSASNTAERLRRLVREWHAAGRPRDVDLRVRAFPRAASTSLAQDAAVIQERWTRFVLDWANRQQS